MDISQMVAIILSWCWLGPQHNFIYTVAKRLLFFYRYCSSLSVGKKQLLIKSVTRGAEVW